MNKPKRRSKVKWIRCFTSKIEDEQTWCYEFHEDGTGFFYNEEYPEMDGTLLPGSLERSEVMAKEGLLAEYKVRDIQ